MVELSTHDAAMVASIIETMRAGKKSCADQMPCEVTVCVPVYNAIMVLPKTLRATWFQRQGIPVEMFITENQSIDGSQDFIRGLRDASVTRDSWLKRSGWRHLQVFEVEQEDGLNWRFPREYANLRNSFQQMFAKVTTEYVLTLDSDVDLPAGSVRSMLEAMKRDPKLGIVGIMYDYATDHVKHGLSMMRAADARMWASRLTIDGCLCSQWCRMAGDAGYKVINMPGITARHRKNEQD